MGPVALVLLFLVADAPTRAGNSPVAQTSAPAVEERPSDCHEIVPAVIAFAKVPRRAVVFFECGGRIVDATGTEQSEADTNRRCDASGCRVCASNSPTSPRGGRRARRR